MKANKNGQRMFSWRKVKYFDVVLNVQDNNSLLEKKNHTQQDDLFKKNKRSNKIQMEGNGKEEIKSQILSVTDEMVNHENIKECCIFN